MRCGSDWCEASRERVEPSQGCRAGHRRSNYSIGLGRRHIWMHWRKARTGRLEFRNRNNGSRKHRLIEWKVERIGHLRGAFGIAVTAGDIAERQLCKFDACVDGYLGLFLDGRWLLQALGFDAGFVVWSQDFCATQIFVGVNVLLFLRLFARSFLASGFGYILGGAGAALRSAGKQTGAKNDCESAAKRLAERHPRVHMRLTRTGEVSICHCGPTAGGHPMGKYYWKARLRAIGIF